MIYSGHHNVNKHCIFIVVYGTDIHFLMMLFLDQYMKYWVFTHDRWLTGCDLIFEIWNVHGLTTSIKRWYTGSVSTTLYGDTQDKTNLAKIPNNTRDYRQKVSETHGTSQKPMPWWNRRNWN